MQQRQFQTYIPLTLLLIAVFFCFTTVIEGTYNFLIPAWTKYLIAIPFICFLTILTKWTKENIIRKVILVTTILVIIFSRSISDRIFLGKQIAYTYLVQDAGFEELYLFSKGKCKLTYGGIVGVTQNHYGTFEIEDSTVFVRTKARLLDLELYKIELDSKPLTIRSKQ